MHAPQLCGQGGMQPAEQTVQALAQAQAGRRAGGAGVARLSDPTGAKPTSRATFSSSPSGAKSSACRDTARRRRHSLRTHKEARGRCKAQQRMVMHVANECTCRMMGGRGHPVSQSVSQSVSVARHPVSPHACMPSLLAGPARSGCLETRLLRATAFLPAPTETHARLVSRFWTDARVEPWQCNVLLAFRLAGPCAWPGQAAATCTCARFCFGKVGTAEWAARTPAVHAPEDRAAVTPPPCALQEVPLVAATVARAAAVNRTRGPQ
jgi:hypothetical protein